MNVTYDDIKWVVREIREVQDCVNQIMKHLGIKKEEKKEKFESSGGVTPESGGKGMWIGGHDFGD